MNKQTKELLAKYYSYLNDKYGEQLTDEKGRTLAEQAQVSFTRVENAFKAICKKNQASNRLPAKMFQRYVELSIEQRKEKLTERYLEAKLKTQENSEAEFCAIVPKEELADPKKESQLRYISVQEINKNTSWKYHLKLPNKTGHPPSLDIVFKEYESHIKINQAYYTDLEEDNVIVKLIMSFKHNVRAEAIKQGITDLEPISFNLGNAYEVEIYSHLGKKPHAIEPFRVSSHFVEHTTRGLFSSLDSNEITKENTTAQINTFYLSELSAPQHRIVLSIAKLLNRKSINTNKPDKENYYSGSFSRPSESEEYITTPSIYCTIYEITKEYTGKNKPSGADQKQAEAILEDLASKEFAIDYEQITKNEKGVITKKRSIKKNRPIIYIDIAEEELVQEGKRSETKIIEVNPIFIDQIANKYITYPGDIIKRLTDAVKKVTGKKRETQEYWNLYNYLRQIQSGKRKKHSIYATNLLTKLNAKEVKKNKKRVKERLDSAIKVCKELGILKEVTTKTGVTGEILYCFELE